MRSSSWPPRTAISLSGRLGLGRPIASSSSSTWSGSLIEISLASHIRRPPHPNPSEASSRSRLGSRARCECGMLRRRAVQILQLPPTFRAGAMKRCRPVVSAHRHCAGGGHPCSNRARPRQVTLVRRAGRGLAGGRAADPVRRYSGLWAATLSTDGSPDPPAPGPAAEPPAGRCRRLRPAMRGMPRTCCPSLHRPGCGTHSEHPAECPCVLASLLLP